jgi:Cu(I)/Ag(I) efflux system protein CusF
MTKQLLIPVFLASLLSTGEIVLAAEKSHEHGSVHAPASKSIAATGTVKSVDAAAGKLVIDHDPIPALNWPRMVMDFQLADPALAGKVKASDKVKFEMKAGDKGAYVITAIEPTP